MPASARTLRRENTELRAELARVRATLADTEKALRSTRAQATAIAQKYFREMGFASDLSIEMTLRQKREHDDARQAHKVARDAKSARTRTRRGKTKAAKLQDRGIELWRDLSPRVQTRIRVKDFAKKMYDDPQCQLIAPGRTNSRSFDPDAGALLARVRPRA